MPDISDVVKGLVPVITCEHAGNNVPERYASHFEHAEQELRSHLGWDPGAREIASFLALGLKAPFYKCESTRLLVEPNRSLHSAGLFSRFVQTLTPQERDEVLNQYYVPYRSVVEQWISEAPQPVLHISVHSFTPVFNEVVRDVDIGLLFDPARRLELDFCVAWKAALDKTLRQFTTAFNEPYKGTDDGFTTYLRTVFPDARYGGIEIEVNQRFVGTGMMDTINTALLNTLREVLKAPDVLKNL